MKASQFKKIEDLKKKKKKFHQNKTESSVDNKMTSYDLHFELPVH